MASQPDIIGIVKELQIECQEELNNGGYSNYEVYRKLFRNFPAIAQALLIAVNELHKIECSDLMDDDGFRKQTPSAKIAANALSRIRSLPSHD
jgi:hypothetical protein